MKKLKIKNVILTFIFAFFAVLTAVIIALDSKTSNIENRVIKVENNIKNK